mgnify:CR=1 FL=1
MANNRFVFNGEVKLDLSTDSLSSSSQLVSGVTAHDRGGNPITGNLVINKYYTGSSEPSSSLGNNGDLYLVVT